MVKDGPELLGKIRLVLKDAALRKALVNAGRSVLERQRDVMEKTAGLVLEAIKKKTIWKNSPDSSELMETLRGEHGCPWDKEQTEQAFKTFLLEEVYELIEAIRAGGLRRDEGGARRPALSYRFHMPDLQGKAAVRHQGRAPCRLTKKCTGDILTCSAPGGDEMPVEKGGKR